MKEYFTLSIKKINKGDNIMLVMALLLIFYTLGRQTARVDYQTIMEYVPIKTVVEKVVEKTVEREIDTNEGLKKVANLRGEQIAICMELIRSSDSLMNSGYNSRILEIQALENKIILQHK